MKAFDIRTKTPDELAGMLADLRKEQFNLRFQKASGQLENTARVKIVRRDIARVLTVLAERAAGRKTPARAAEPKAAKPAPKAETRPAAGAKAAPEKKAAASAKTSKAKTAAKKTAKAKAK